MEPPQSSGKQRYANIIKHLQIFPGTKIKGFSNEITEPLRLFTKYVNHVNLLKTQPTKIKN